MPSPPLEDFALVDGCKNASTECRKLVKTAQNSLHGRSVVTSRSEDVFNPDSPAGSVRHMVVYDDGKLLGKHTSDHTIWARHLSTLESVSVGFGDRFVPWPWIVLQTPIVQSLRRLDLHRCFPCFFFDPRLAVKLNFPNLLELRLAYFNPTYSVGDILYSKYFLLESEAQETQYLPGRVAAFSALKDALIELQHLRLLSPHVSLTYTEKVEAAREYHEKEHGSDGSVLGYRHCKGCTLDRDDEAAKLRERSETKKLAEALPKLECVRWTDAWRDYFDEIGQREYEVSRNGKGEVGIVDRGVIDESWPCERYCFL